VTAEERRTICERADRVLLDAWISERRRRLERRRPRRTSASDIPPTPKPGMLYRVFGLDEMGWKLRSPNARSRPED
jgi:hypothetical protein